MAEGKIIEYIDQRKIVLSVCVKDRENKLQLLTISNHEVSISPKRALLISSTTLDTSMNFGNLPMRKIRPLPINTSRSFPLEELLLMITYLPS